MTPWPTSVKAPGRKSSPWWRVAGFQVLDVKLREAPRETVEVVHRVLPRAHAPEAVQLEINEFGIRPTNQLVVHDRTLHGGIVEIVAVIKKPAACPADRLADLIEPFRISLDGVERLPVLLVQAGQSDVSDAAFLRLRNVLLEVRLKLGLSEVHADAP